MQRRILDLSGEGAHLKKNRGALLVSIKDGGERRDVRAALDEIEAVIVHAREASYSNEALRALAEAGIPLVLCDQGHRPKAWLWPAEHNFEQSRRMQAQLEAPKSLPKSLWAKIVRAKIEQQAALLDVIGQPSGPLKDMAKRVLTGDSGNMEAAAAYRYWPLAMGLGFRRDQRLSGTNALLNYGYMILRASVARSIMAAGLHPSIGLHHHNRFNAFCLADDVMEPFRPQVDAAVIVLRQAGIEEVTPDAKLKLVEVMSREIELSDGFTPLSRATERLATSLAQSFVSKENKLELPKSKSFFMRERLVGRAKI